MTSHDTPLRSGLFISFEGADATGKSTQARTLAHRLGAVFTFEPGDSPLGATLRSICLGDTFDPAPRAEMLLMAADRAEHVARVIKPALDAGKSVVCDRYTDSTAAYQGGGRGIDLGDIDALNDLATGRLYPDLVILIHVSADCARARHAERGDLDRMERVSSEFTSRVRATYLKLAAQNPNMVVIDGEGTEAQVAERVWDAVMQRFG